MANINIYGTLFSNASKDNDKVIVLGSQVYGNDTTAPAKDESGVYPETGKLISKAEFNGLLGTGWTSGLVPGSQYDINRFFKAKINNISANYVPYTGATKDVSLGSHAITSAGVALSTNNIKPSSVSSITSNSGIYLLINYSGGYNCIQLERLYKDIAFTVSPDSGSNTSSLTGHLKTLYNKVNHITRPLRFMGIITSKNTGNLPPTGAAAPEIGDVWHFNDDVVINGTQYYKGDEVVYVNMPGNAWEILGQSITPIPTGSITFENLESN